MLEQLFKYLNESLSMNLLMCAQGRADRLN